MSRCDFDSLSSQEKPISFSMVWFLFVVSSAHTAIIPNKIHCPKENKTQECTHQSQVPVPPLMQFFSPLFSVSVCNLCKNDNFSHLYTRGNKNKSKDVTYAKWLHDQQTVLNMCSNVNRATEEGLILSIEHFSCIPHTGAASTHAHTATMCAPSWIQSSQEWKTKTEEFKTILIVLARHFSFSASNGEAHNKHRMTHWPTLLCAPICERDSTRCTRSTMHNVQSIEMKYDLWAAWVAAEEKRMQKNRHVERSEISQVFFLLTLRAPVLVVTHPEPMIWLAKRNNCQAF